MKKRIDQFRQKYWLWGNSGALYAYVSEIRLKKQLKRIKNKIEK